MRKAQFQVSGDIAAIKFTNIQIFIRKIIIRFILDKSKVFLKQISTYIIFHTCHFYIKFVFNKEC